MIKMNEGSTFNDFQKLKEELGCTNFVVTWDFGTYCAVILPEAFSMSQKITVKSKDPWDAINLAAEKFVLNRDNIKIQNEQRSNLIDILQSNMLLWLDDELKSLEDNVSESKLGQLPALIRGLENSKKEFAVHMLITQLLTYTLNK